MQLDKNAMDMGFLCLRSECFLEIIPVKRQKLAFFSATFSDRVEGNWRQRFLEFPESE